MGSGMFGDLESEENEKEFLLRIKELLHLPVIKHSGWLNRRIKKVAVCGGSGAFLIHAAIKAGAGIFIDRGYQIP